MSKAVFSGSFDPVTVGHMDLIYRGSRMFDELVVAVLINVSKQPLFSLEERVKDLEELTKDLPNVTVCSFEGLLVDFLEQISADVILRGLRTGGDFEYELPIAQTNRVLRKNVDTVFLATSPEHSYISSSGVKEVLRFGGDVHGMVPEYIENKLINNR